MLSSEARKMFGFESGTTEDFQKEHRFYKLTGDEIAVVEGSTQ